MRIYVTDSGVRVNVCVLSDFSQELEYVDICKSRPQI
jgi:hypothetical protein